MKNPIKLYLDGLPTIENDGQFCYVTSSDFRELVLRAPDNAELFARGDDTEIPTINSAISLHWKGRGWKTTICRRSVWGEINPSDAFNSLIGYLNKIGAKWRTTPGGLAGEILNRWTMIEDKSLPVNKYKRSRDFLPYGRKDREYIRTCQQGGAMRIRRTYARDAIVIDISQAYKNAMGSIPVGRPQVFSGLRWKDVLRLWDTGYRGTVEGYVEPLINKPIVLAYRDKRRNLVWSNKIFCYKGWIGELVQAILLQLVRPVNDFKAVLFLETGTMDEKLKELSVVVPVSLFKLLYRSMWPGFDVTAGWIGFWGKTKSGSVYDKEDRTLQWTYESRDTASISAKHKLQRPDICGSITSNIRKVLMYFWAVLPHELVHACMVDALIIDADYWEKEHEWINDKADKQGGYCFIAKAASQGEYFGAYPGQYLCGSRLRLSGIPRSEHSISVLLSQIIHLYLDAGKPSSNMISAVMSIDGRGEAFRFRSFEVPEDASLFVKGRF